MVRRGPAPAAAVRSLSPPNRRRTSRRFRSAVDLILVRGVELAVLPRLARNHGKFKLSVLR
jgi:RNase P/RNase MRP subunit p30